MPDDNATNAPDPAPTPGYRALLGNREFAGLYAGFTLTVAASTLSGFALGTLVDRSTGSPFLTAVSMYGATFATVLGATTLMSVADGDRPRRTLVALQFVALAGACAQAVPGLPLAARFGLLLLLGFFQSLNTGTRMGLLAEVVPASAYVPARSLMNITAGGTAVLGFTLGALLLRHLTPQGLFLTAAALTAAGLAVTAATVRERSVRPPRRPGLRETWATNAALLSRSGPRALLLNLWVPNGLIVGCEALFIPYAQDHAGCPAGRRVGGDAARRPDRRPAAHRGVAAPQRVRPASAARRAVPPLRPAPVDPVAAVAVFLASAGFAATLPLQERLLALTPEQVRGQVQGVESAGRMTWQGIGAALAGATAQFLSPATTITALAALSVAVTVLSRPYVDRTRPLSFAPRPPRR